jgi:hypothetical protein
MSTLDAGLFNELSRNITNGQWLGTYNQDTLVKNPLTNILIAISKVFNVKYNFFHLNIYFISIMVLMFSLRKIIPPYLNLFLVLLLIFNPENFSQYKATIIREDFEISLIILTSAFHFLYQIEKKNYALILMSITIGLLLINRDSGIHYKIFFFTYILIDFKKSKRYKPKYILYFSSIVIFIIPKLTISNINNHYYNFFGANIFFDSNYSKLYGKLTSVRPKGYTTKKSRNVIPNKSIDLIQKYGGKNISKVIANMPPGFKNVSTTKGEWGAGFMWGLYYSIVRTFEKTHDTADSPKNFNIVFDILIREIDIMCSKESLPLSCTPKNYGFLSNPEYWSEVNPFLYFIKETPSFFLKFIHFKFGEKQNFMVMSGSNGDLGWSKNYREEAYKMLNDLGYSKSDYKKYRLNTTTLKALQYFGYGLRHLSILMLLSFLILIIYRKLRFETKGLFETTLPILILFLLHTGTFYLFFLTILHRAFKYITISSIYIPIITILIISHFMKILENKRLVEKNINMS